MPEPIQHFWNNQLEDLITEIARQAVIAGVPLAAPGIVDAVLRNEEANSGSKNPLAFRKLRDNLMMVFIVQKKAYDDLGPEETAAIVAQISAALAARFSEKLGGPSVR